MASNESWKSNAKNTSGAERTLKSRGDSQKGKGSPQGKSYKAENYQRKEPTLGDRGPGSSTAFALLREEAQRLRAQRKIPGNLGYQQPVDTSRYSKYTTAGPDKGRKK